eukprot:423837_1
MSFHLNTAAQFKSLKAVHPAIRNTVFGYIRQSIADLLPDNAQVSAFLSIQYICLWFYGAPDVWDQTAMGEGLTNIDNVITKTNEGGWSYRSAFLINICEVGHHCWRSKVHKLEKMWNLIGIWRVISDKKPPTNTYFTEGYVQGYALCLLSGRLVSLDSGGGYVDHSKKQYCDGIQTDDIIDMHLDLNKLELSFSVNGTNYGSAFEGVRKAKYRAAICLEGKESAIELLSQ